MSQEKHEIPPVDVSFCLKQEKGPVKSARRGASDLFCPSVSRKLEDSTDWSGKVVLPTPEPIEGLKSQKAAVLRSRS